MMIFNALKHIMILPVTWSSRSGYSTACRSFPIWSRSGLFRFSFLSSAWHIARLGRQWALQTHCQCYVEHESTPRRMYQPDSQNWPNELHRNRSKNLVRKVY